MPLCKHRCANICKYTWDGCNSSAGRGVWILSNDFTMVKPHWHQHLPLLTWHMDPLLRTQTSLGFGFLMVLCLNRVTNQKELSKLPRWWWKSSLLIAHTQGGITLQRWARPAFCLGLPGKWCEARIEYLLCDSLAVCSYYQPFFPGTPLSELGKGWWRLEVAWWTWPWWLQRRARPSPCEAASHLVKPFCSPLVFLCQASPTLQSSNLLLTVPSTCQEPIPL